MTFLDTLTITRDADMHAYVARENSIWPIFKTAGAYSAIEDRERTILFSLYSYGYINTGNYVLAVTDIEAAKILLDYDTKIAGIVNDELVVIAGIAAKRFITLNIDALMAANKLEDKRQKILADIDMWDAKMRSLDADRAALVTLLAKITAEEKKIAARIQELEALIQLEIAQLAEVDIAITEKQLSLAKTQIQLASKDIDISRKDIAILQVANEIATLELRTVEASLELADVDMKVARTQLDVAQTENQIVKAGFTETELEVEKARVAVDRAELEMFTSKAALAELAVDLINKEVADAILALSDEAVIQTTKVRVAAARQTEHEQSIAYTTEKTVFSLLERIAAANLELDIVSTGNTLQDLLDKNKMIVHDMAEYAARTAMDAALTAATTMAMATISSELVHTIKKQT